MSERANGDSRLADIRTVFDGGGIAQIIKNYSSQERASLALINAYAHSWYQLDGFVFSENEKLQTEEQPSEQIMAVFERLWNSRKYPEVKDFVEFALIGHFALGEDIKLAELLFTEGETEYDQDRHCAEVINKLETICRDGDLHEDPNLLAHLLINYAGSVSVDWIAQPPEIGGFSVAEAQLGIRVILTDGEPSDLS